VLVCLANYADESGICYPSQTKLVGDTSLDRKTIIAAMQRLTEEGLIADTGLRKGATGQVVVYKLLGPSGLIVHYTYKTSDPITGEYYLGKRSWDGDPQADTYRGSGQWVYQMSASNRVLVREVLRCFDTVQEALAEERRLFVEFQHDPLCRNQGTPKQVSIRVKQVLADNKAKREETVPKFPVNGPVFPDPGFVETVPIFPPNSPDFPTEQSQNSLETVPKFPPNSPENGTGNHQEPSKQNLQGTLIEPSGTPERDLVDEAVAIWNRVCGGTSGVVKKITTPRRAAVRARLHEDMHNDLADWLAYCETITASAFLSGNSERGWTADFDWAVKPANMIKVLEGRYINKPQKLNGRPADSRLQASELILGRRLPGREHLDEPAGDWTSTIEGEFNREP
jgi:hypothetical protein